MQVLVRVASNRVKVARFDILSGGLARVANKGFRKRWQEGIGMD